MLIRIVRMTFAPEKVPVFLEIFRNSQDQIRQVPGCRFLELWQDADQPHTYCTHSHWDSAEALNAYRDSELFGRVWPATKALFVEPAQAFSVHQVLPEWPYGNITTRELDRDIINLHLPEPDSYFFTDEEINRLYRPGFLDELRRGIDEYDKGASNNETPQP